jgi:DNA-directed RNA polymerase subunit D
MKIIDKKENKIIFQAEIEDSLANSIRRYLNHISVLAIDEVEISKNDSALYDETVAHRIGLIPLKMNKSLSEGKEIKLKINKKEGKVYSGDLKGDVEVVYEGIPITSLNEGQELTLTAIGKIGKGKDHSKFSPGLMFYRNVVDLSVDKECSPEIVDICPKNVFKSDKGKIVVENPTKCDVCEMCVEFCEKKGKGKIEFTPTKELIIQLESFGQLDLKDVLKKSIDILKKDLTEISKKINK